MMRRNSRPSVSSSLALNGTTERGDQTPEILGPASPFQVVDECGALGLDHVVVAPDDGVEQPLAAPEVVVERRGVALPGLLHDGRERHREHTMSREQVLAGAQQQLPGLGGAACHQPGGWERADVIPAA